MLKFKEHVRQIEEKADSGIAAKAKKSGMNPDGTERK